MATTPDPTIKELGTQDVCKVLQPMFEHRSVSLSLLNYYKRNGIVEPTGTNGSRSQKYSFFDTVALAAVLDLTDRGVVTRLISDIVEGIQSGIVNEPIQQHSGNLLVCYDPTDIAEEVKNHWDAFIEEHSGGA